MGLALVLALIVAPEDADQGISQRIFYIHVPIALTAYFCFGLGAVKALFLLLYDAVFAVLSWASFEYVVTE